MNLYLAHIVCQCIWEELFYNMSSDNSTYKIQLSFLGKTKDLDLYDYIFQFIAQEKRCPSNIEMTNVIHPPTAKRVILAFLI